MSPKSPTYEIVDLVSIISIPVRQIVGTLDESAFIFTNSKL